MATVNKDFKIKSGLVVEGASATVNGYDVLTKATTDENYIINLIGGTATSSNTPNTVVKRDGNGDFAAGTITANIVGDVTGNADTATTLETSRTIELTGDVTGSVSFDGSQNVQIQATLDGSFATDTELSNAISQEVLDRDSAISDAISQEVLDRDSAISTALTSANNYTNQEIAALVDSAPAMLDTLNELAAAIADNPNYASDVTNLVATKADTTYVNDQDAAVDLAAQGYASDAQTAAETFATNAINALTTSDIEEGSNLYYTDDRAQDAVGAMLQNAVQSNIEITYNNVDNVLSITAENGVADSTTADLAEDPNGNSSSGTWYFTDARALDAINANNITPSSVTIDTYRREEATQQYVASASTVNVHELTGGYESAKYLVRVVGWDGGVKHSQITEILLTVDGNNNVAISEYGMVHTSTAPLATFSANLNIATNKPILTATTAVNGCEIIAAATMLSWAD